MEEVQKHLYVLILAGGGGTRLWPVSRDALPKQFLRLFGGKSLFQHALDRALALVPPDRIYISTAERYYDLIRKEARQIPSENIIQEPMRRDTALAEGVGAVYIHHRDPQAVICNFASDHLISPLSIFTRQMKMAAEAAYKTGLFTAVGIVPTKPHTGLGHIQARKHFPGQPDEILLGEKFVEKPLLELAKKYTKSGEYYWNAHLFVWKAAAFLQLLRKFAPKTYSLLPKLEKSLGSHEERQVLKLVFQMAPTLATDYAVAEKLKKFICLPATFSWSDVGDWQEVWKQLPHDADGNSFVSGNKKTIISLESKDNLVYSKKQVICLSGIKDLVLIETKDSILICKRDNSQSVKKIVEALREKKLNKVL